MGSLEKLPFPLGPVLEEARYDRAATLAGVATDDFVVLPIALHLHPSPLSPSAEKIGVNDVLVALQLSRRTFVDVGAGEQGVDRFGVVSVENRPFDLAC